MSIRRLFLTLTSGDRAPRRHPRMTRTKLRLQVLEQRSLLSAAPWSASTTTDPPVTYEIISPEQTNVGAVANFEVIALDAAGQPAHGYSGTASLSETGAGTTSELPTSLSFHHGHSEFQATFTDTGTASFTATETDAVNTTPITGSGATTVDPATTATQLVVYIPAHETPGQPVNVVVEALDAAGHVVPGYTGTVTLTSLTDAGATLPESYQFTAGDAGRHTFQVTFSADSGTGEQTITATDDSAVPLVGSVSTNLASPATVTHLAVRIPENVQQGVPVEVLVLALNANNRVVSSYTDTVSFAPSGASTTSSETLPSDYTFTTGRWWRGDNGRHDFQLTFNDTGAQSFVVTDASGNTSPVVTTNVYAAPTVTSLRIIAPENIPEGVAVPIKVEALDAANHVVKVFTDTVTLDAASSTVTGPTTPHSGTEGNLVFQVTAPTGSAGTTLTLTATDTTSNLTATTTVNVVTPSAHGNGRGDNFEHGRFGFGGFGFGGFSFERLFRR